MSQSVYRKKISFGSVVAQGITIMLLFVFWRLEQRWAVAPLAVILAFLFFGLPGLIRKKEARFHQKALMLLSTGKAADIPRLARNQFLLSLFGNSAPIDAKLGMAYCQTGDYGPAVECLKAAIPLAPPRELPALQAAYVKALFISGHPEQAEEEGRRMLKSGLRLPEVLVSVARCRMALGKMGPQTMKMLEDARREKPTGDVGTMLMLAETEMRLARGQKVTDFPEQVDGAQSFVAVWGYLVRGRIREKRGNRDDAISAYRAAVKLGAQEGCWFADLAYGRLQVLATKRAASHQVSADNSETGPIHKKRKRRR